MTTTSHADLALDEPETSADRQRGHQVVVRGARKRYGAVEALRGVDLDIEAGRFMVLLGPSGSGKTTLLRGLAGIERFDAGRVSFGGITISDRHAHVPAERRELAMVFQDYALWPHLSVQQNVAYALRRHHFDSRSARMRVGETLDRVGLAAKAASYPNELSGGQQQRVALARAIVGRPALLLFDEPLSNLDADLREHLRVEIATLTRESGATALYITHDQAEAFALADEITVLREGTLEQRGTPEEIFRHPATPFVARFTGLAGAFAGTAIATREGHLHVRVGDHVLVASADTPISPGEAVDLLIRPGGARLHASTGSAASADPAGSVRAESIPGTVVDSAFRGRGYDHVIECAYGRLTSVFDARRWPRGTHCQVAINPDDCLAFRAGVSNMA